MYFSLDFSYSFCNDFLHFSLNKESFTKFSNFTNFFLTIIIFRQVIKFIHSRVLKFETNKRNPKHLHLRILVEKHDLWYITMSCRERRALHTLLNYFSHMKSALIHCRVNGNKVHCIFLVEILGVVFGGRLHVCMVVHDTHIVSFFFNISFRTLISEYTLNILITVG